MMLAVINTCSVLVMLMRRFIHVQISRNNDLLGQGKLRRHIIAVLQQVGDISILDPHLAFGYFLSSTAYRQKVYYSKFLS